MELRHLRYFIAVGEALNLTKAAARLRLAQPALSRQVQALEDEIGVDLLKRSPRGVMLTAEGQLFFEEARRLIADAERAVRNVRALARGEFGELHIGYAPSPTVEILPPALAAFQKSNPGVSVVLHDLSSNEMAEGLRTGNLHLAIMVRPTEENAVGLEFELLKSYPFHVASSTRHAFARLKSVPVSRLSDEPIVTLRRKDYTDFHRLVMSVLSGLDRPPQIVAECDGSGSLFAEVQAGRGVALLPSVYRHTVGERLRLRPLTPANLPTMDVVASRAARGDITPAAEKFLKQIRAITHPRRSGSASTR